MGAIAHLLLGNLDTLVPVFLEHGVSKRPGAIGIGALANCEVGVVLVQWYVLIQRCNTGLNLNSSLECTLAADPVYHCLEVCRSGSAATADKAKTKFLYELLVSGCQLVWCEWVVGAITLQNR